MMIIISKQMGFSPALMVLLLLVLVFVWQPSAAQNDDNQNLHPQYSCAADPHLISQLEDARLKLAHLESIIEESLATLNLRSLYINGSQKLLMELTDQVDLLHSILSSIKNDSSNAKERVNKLEEQVRLLWAASRKNNFEIHTSESKLQDAEKRLERLASEVNQVSDIVTEQWIQVQRLEQALHFTEIRTKKIKRHLSSTRCTFLKFIRTNFGNINDKLRGIFERYLSEVKRYHHQLQDFVRNEMMKSTYTAAFAHQELIFFLASALITFPALSVFMFLSSQF